MWLERGVDGSVPLTKPEDPEEVSFRHNQFNSGKVPSRGYHKTEIFRSRYQHENGKSTTYPWYFKNCRILCVLFLLVFLAIIALIRANIPLNAPKIQTSISNELMGPTAGPYYHIDVSAFVGKLQGMPKTRCL
ncbi:unnamed protein product [Allacma fusca]|uniref:Uncharacterized protein n=1 Tax=Allacma fusca TaxID=39272 RepID=A0A8J2K807_9HEXA|nr:unnamed protein product [Allacma fusca]